jgi:hypothetical protein
MHSINYVITKLYSIVMYIMNIFIYYNNCSLLLFFYYHIHTPFLAVFLLIVEGLLSMYDLLVVFTGLLSIMFVVFCIFNGLFTGVLVGVYLLFILEDDIDFYLMVELATAFM